jgi:predicted GIY-YIG superfamily endonuclease
MGQVESNNVECTIESNNVKYTTTDTIIEIYPPCEYIYILQLENGKYYVGKTRDIKKRFNEHQSGNGSAWTSKYKPICIEKEIRSTSQFDEDNYVKEYMMKYGIDNVRGGVYSSVILNFEQKRLLEKEFRGALNLCFQCGKSGHYIRCCPNKFVNIVDSSQNNPTVPIDIEPNSGKIWTKAEDAFLIKDFNGGTTITDLALTRGRSEYAILCRLNKLGQTF